MDSAAGPMPGIFISYRREDTSGYTGRLYDRLSAHFGQRSVFMDVDAIPLGRDFVSVIENEVGSCDVVVAVIGKHWLSVTDGSGRRRLDDPGDLLRQELEAALSRDILVIPALVGGAQAPRADELPQALTPLARRNALEFSDATFGAVCSVLIKAIEDAVRPRARIPARVRRTLLLAAAVCLAAVGVWLWPTARHDQTITFVDLPSKLAGDPPVALSATATSSLPVEFEVTGSCTLSGSALSVKKEAGSCTVTASQAGDKRFNPARDVAKTFAILAGPNVSAGNGTTSAGVARGRGAKATDGKDAPDAKDTAMRDAAAARNAAALRDAATKAAAAKAPAVVRVAGIAEAFPVTLSLNGNPLGDFDGLDAHLSVPSGPASLRAVNRAIFLDHTFDLGTLKPGEDRLLALTQVVSAYVGVLRGLSESYVGLSIAIDGQPLAGVYPVPGLKISASTHDIAFTWSQGKLAGRQVKSTVDLSAGRKFSVQAEPDNGQVRVQVTQQN